MLKVSEIITNILTNNPNITQQDKQKMEMELVEHHKLDDLLREADKQIYQIEFAEQTNPVIRNGMGLLIGLLSGAIIYKLWIKKR